MNAETYSNIASRIAGEEKQLVELGAASDRLLAVIGAREDAMAAVERARDGVVKQSKLRHLGKPSDVPAAEKRLAAAEKHAVLADVDIRGAMAAREDVLAEIDTVEVRIIALRRERQLSALRDNCAAMLEAHAAVEAARAIFDQALARQKAVVHAMDWLGGRSDYVYRDFTDGAPVDWREWKLVAEAERELRGQFLELGVEVDGERTARAVGLDDSERREAMAAVMRTVQYAVQKPTVVEEARVRTFVDGKELFGHVTPESHQHAAPVSIAEARERQFLAREPWYAG